MPLLRVRFRDPFLLGSIVNKWEIEVGVLPAIPERMWWGVGVTIIEPHMSPALLIGSSACPYASGKYVMTF